MPLISLDDHEKMAIPQIQNWLYLGAKKEKKPPKFAIGDLVRIAILKDKIEGAYRYTFTEPVYRINGINSDLPVTMYTVENYNKSPVVGNFYESELQLFTGDFYKFEVLQKRTVNNKEQLKVKYLGYDDRLVTNKSRYISSCDNNV